jgi:hypothetical protein
MHLLSGEHDGIINKTMGDAVIFKADRILGVAATTWSRLARPALRY